MNVLVQRVLFLLWVVALKEPFLCVLGETSQNILLCITLTLNTANNLFRQDTLASVAASSYKVWLQNVLWFRRYHPVKYLLKLLTSAVTLTLDAVIQFYRRTPWLTKLYYQTQLS